MPRDTEFTVISQIFLSATAQDCNVYRKLIRDDLHKYLPRGKVFLQEDWAEGAIFVVDACEQKVKNCDAFLGLFGFRYGWIPPGHTKSITELEFRWAVSHWSQRNPPIFILLPEKNSEADQQLKDWAQNLTETEFTDEASRIAARNAQQDFLSDVNKWVSEDGRQLIVYCNQDELKGKALSCIQNWNLELYRKALDVRRAAEGSIPANELGRIGRDTQLDALTKALEVFHDHSNERAIALLVHGPENFGQREFATFLSRWDDWENAQVFCGQASELDNINSLICWVCGQLQEPIIGTPTIEALAGILTARFARNSVVFIVRSLGRRSDRLVVFLDQLWNPLVNALTTRPLTSRLHRLYWIVIDHEELILDDIPIIWRNMIDAEDVDYHKLLPLPLLGKIMERDIKRWLKEMHKNKIISVDETKREEIVKYVAEAEGFPPNVYNRLDIAGFWKRSS